MKFDFFSSKILRYRHFPICHFHISSPKITKIGIIDHQVTRLIFYLHNPTFIMQRETRGQGRSWSDSHFTISSIIDRFPKKCSLRSTVQAGPILFYQVIGRLPRYVMLKYFWICKSLLPFDFLNILIPFDRYGSTQCSYLVVLAIQTTIVKQFLKLTWLKHILVPKNNVP